MTLGQVMMWCDGKCDAMNEHLCHENQLCAFLFTPSCLSRQLIMFTFLAAAAGPYGSEAVVGIITANSK
jgi:hypothetical protein